MDFSSFSRLEWVLMPERASAADWPAIAIAAALSAMATLALLLWLAPARFGRERDGRGAMEGDEDPRAADALDCEFVLRGSSPRPLTAPARTLLASLDLGMDRLSALSAHLESACASIRTDIEALVLYGTTFRHHCQRPDGTAFEIAGWPSGGVAHLAIRPASEDARALRGARGALMRAEAEVALLRGLVDRAPVLSWSTGADGQVDWANQPYRDRFVAGEPISSEPRGLGGFAHPFAHVIEEVPLTARGDFARRRVLVPGPGEGDPEWYEVSEASRPEGGGVGFALPADDLVTAEATLRRFIETLTETFAHLPIGLAVFDKNRRLGLFNPALTDLVKIDAVWLAGRPSLRDFLERLRETRQMPDQKDFTSWRRKLSELEEGAREGTYEENWVLPSGKIFHVTGRPHPQGAVAFLFEDISTSIQLERRYRSELELSQATLDRVSEAVAVFDASGGLVFVNSAFNGLWELDAEARGLDVAGVARHCAARSAATPVWTRLTEFVTGAGSRASFADRVSLADGRELHLLVAPLPDAASLVVVRDLTAERRALGGGEAEPRDGSGLASEMALRQLRLPAEAAIRHLAAAIPTAPTTGAFQALALAARDLSEGLARSEVLESLGAETETGAGPLSLLEAALARRGLRLEVSGEVAPWPHARRRLALALGLAAADLARPGTTVTLTDLPGGIDAEVEAGPVAGETLACAIARRMTETEGGAFILSRSEGRARLRLSLPTAPTSLSAESS